MNLSRAAKKFRSLEPQESSAPKKAAKKQAKGAGPGPEPVREPVVVPAAPVVEKTEAAPVVEPTPVAAAPEPPQPKPVPVKMKRPRFVREKAEKRERVNLPPLPTPSKNPLIRVMTRNLPPVVKDEPKPGVRV